MDKYSFILKLTGGKVVTSDKFPESNYRGFIRACEKMCEQHKHKIVDLKICCHTESGETYIRNPELGEVYGW